jgi:hypothetical protein
MLDAQLHPVETGFRAYNPTTRRYRGSEPRHAPSSAGFAHAPPRRVSHPAIYSAEPRPVQMERARCCAMWARICRRTRGGWDLIKSVTDHVPKSREDDE